jgi:ferredoxin
MVAIVTENCQHCRFTECVTECPSDCFHGDDEMLYIDPKACIECGECVPICPVKAIYEEEDLPEDKAEWKAINAERAPKLPRVTKKQKPLPTAVDKLKSLGFG